MTPWLADGPAKGHWRRSASVIEPAGPAAAHPRSDPPLQSLPRLPASVQTCHWGAFDAGLPPVMTVASGQRFGMATVSGGAAVRPPPGFCVPSELQEIHARSTMHAPGHIPTGPVAADGAMPGDTLELRIVDMQLRQDWG